MNKPISVATDKATAQTTASNINNGTTVLTCEQLPGCTALLRDTSSSQQVKPKRQAGRPYKIPEEVLLDFYKRGYSARRAAKEYERDCGIKVDQTTFSSGWRDRLHLAPHSHGRRKEVPLEALDFSKQGISAREISRRLSQTPGYRIGHNTVSRHLKRQPGFKVFKIQPRFSDELIRSACTPDRSLRNTARYLGMSEKHLARRLRIMEPQPKIGRYKRAPNHNLGVQQAPLVTSLSP